MGDAFHCDPKLSPKRSAGVKPSGEEKIGGEENSPKVNGTKIGVAHMFSWIRRNYPKYLKASESFD